MLMKATFIASFNQRGQCPLGSRFPPTRRTTYLVVVPFDLLFKEKKIWASYIRCILLNLQMWVVNPHFVDFSPN